MQKIVGVKFKSVGKIYFFDPQQIYLRVGDNVIVETARGMEFGMVASKVRMVKESELKHPIKPVLRKATREDERAHARNLEKAEEALKICQQQVDKNKLDMKLVRAEYTFDASKIIFYFTADGRVDFRELVKDLAAIFKIRIELRQIGVRDEAKLMGGIGCCGRELCCHRWLGEFEPVSIKMAKEQGLSLNPGKISGICGRLLCCLQFEHECYECAIKALPYVGDRVKTPDGFGVIQKLNVLGGKATVELDNEGGIREYTKDKLKTVERRKGKRKSNSEEDEALNADELKELKELSRESLEDENKL